jgi:hypothetical protein
MRPTKKELRPAMLRRQRAGFLGAVAFLLGVALIAGCSKAPTPPKTPPQEAPNTELTYAPVEYDTVSFRVRFYWSGYDVDGEVVAFRWVVDPDSATLKDAKRTDWNRTTGKDTTLLFLVDPVQEVKQHVFVVSAEDNDGNFDPTPATRYFSAKTIPPTSRIEKGPAATNPIVGPNYTYEWSGIDPDGGETGGKAPVDSFQYLLLRPFGKADTTGGSNYDALPAFSKDLYISLVNAATGDGLPRVEPYQRYDDWKWQGFRGIKRRFRNQTSGEYVFALRAVDIAGATEKNLEWVRNIRHFTVSDKNPGPQLTVNASILVQALPSATGPADFVRRQLQIFEGETISFSWSGDASFYGGEVVGYNYALDDTSTLGNTLDERTIGVTLGPDKLFPGPHFLYVRCVDDGGLITNAAIPLLIVHPTFKDPGAAREILFVDDALSPGNSTQASGSFPSDPVETDWFTLQEPSRPLSESRFPRITASFPGVTVTEWDTYERGAGSVEGRKQPEPKDLASVSTVVWIAGTNNTASTPIALWKTLVGGSYSELGGYLRAGGTLVLSGYNLVDCATDPRATLKNLTRGLCFQYEPGSFQWNLDFFPRVFMGVSYVIPNEDGRRALGAKDFVAAYPTAAGKAAGFDTAYVDTGLPATGAKWNTNSDITGSASFVDQNLTPGLFRVEGWVMMSNISTSFGCEDIRNFGREYGVSDPNRPIAQPIYTYHGVRAGVLRDGGPSPRGGRVCGLLCQSHDLGSASGGTGIYNPAAAIGRVVIVGFPFYFLKDQQASDILFNAYSYVAASPTLP